MIHRRLMKLLCDDFFVFCKFALPQLFCWPRCTTAVPASPDTGQQCRQTRRCGRCDRGTHLVCTLEHIFSQVHTLLDSKDDVWFSGEPLANSWTGWKRSGAECQCYRHSGRKYNGPPSPLFTVKCRM